MKILAAPARIFNRLMLWLSILRNLQGVNLKMQLGLFVSAITDTFLQIASSSIAASPMVYVSGIVHYRRYRAYFHVRAFSDDLYSIMPEREGDVNETILSGLKKGDVFIDVGANVGYYSVLAGKIVGETGQVISIEPIPDTARVLNLNLKLNRLKNVKVLRKAAWNSNELISMHIPKGFFGMASIYEPHGVADILEVEGFTLDGLPEVKKVDFLKIDAEGSEYPILEGARKTLKTTRHVVLEASNQRDEMIRLLREENFKIWKLRFTTYLFAQNNRMNYVYTS